MKPNADSSMVHQPQGEQALRQQAAAVPTQVRAPSAASASGTVLQTVAVRAQRQPWARSAFDWAFAVGVLLLGTWAWWRWQPLMNGYEQLLLGLSLPALIALGWFWRPLAWLLPSVALGVAAAVALYRGDVQRAGQVFGLKYLLASQSALLWMGVLVWVATLFHWIGLWASRGGAGAGADVNANAEAHTRRHAQAQAAIAQATAQPADETTAPSQAAAAQWGGRHLPADVRAPVPAAAQATAQVAKQTATPSAPSAPAPHMAQRLGTRLAWVAVALGLIGSGVRWHESYLLNPQAGHIPLSNLYEVFVLFIWMTLLFGLYFESRRQARGLNAFVLLLVSAAVAFVFWYSATRQGQLIQPLVPALQSWWMKLHVPANFVGYGLFALAAMAGLMSLLKTASARALWLGLVGLPLLVAAVLLALAYGLGWAPAKLASLSRMALMLVAVLAALIALRRPLGPRLPAEAVLDDVMYKAIATGFAFFTIATFTGALWAAEAWGAYWSWDPKEVWALIVWLNYASWLHLRLVKGLRGRLAAWWALAGLVVVTFAFIGVNLFLGGMHSYGRI